MPPRKASMSEPAEPTRRSSRISAQATYKEPEIAVASTKRSTSKTRKRPAAAANEGDDSTNASGAADAAEGQNTGESLKKRAKQSESIDEEVEDVVPALPEVNIGDPLPNLILKNEKDEDVQVAELASPEKGGVILFLVPKADTPGCTTQACGFRDVYPDFTSSGYQVFCLSADTPAAQTKWQSKKSLPYPLLSDRQRVLISALGAGEGGKTKRSHFIFGKDGKLLEKKIPVKPADSPKQALDFIKAHAPA